MRIIVDAFGGDNAPLAILQGCEMAVREYGVDILAVGSEKTIRRSAEKTISRSIGFRLLMWKRLCLSRWTLQKW